jgi:hypothetical protein
MKTQIEKWIDSYYFSEKYEVSNLGKVRNKITKQIYLSSRTDDGYEAISLNNKKSKITIRLHRLIYLSFYPQTPLDLNIHHIDHNKINNKLSNLDCIGHDEHASMHAKLRINSNNFPQIFKKGNENPSYKGKIVGICPETHEVKYVITGKQEIKSLGFNYGHVYSVISGKRKKHRNLFFRRISDNSKLKVGQYFNTENV